MPPRPHASDGGDGRPQAAGAPPFARPGETPEQTAARRDRQALLRAFETTTLSRANFCALKGLKDDALEAALQQARQERAERPPRDPAFAGGGPGAGRPDGGRRGPR